ncbi:lig_chan-Glu_bd domain-containing protein [Trichonephila clavata]|uniref:Lig_chan-Glu_bd domain-containing protein n=1 Tax=Trichonephila clavata TaxID=2740835 RepID=A0A8X6M4Q1_TRICU|nr:lig_chan-Glu_bd domain-containing protein [Trichonephila clavata]
MEFPRTLKVSGTDSPFFLIKETGVNTVISGPDYLLLNVLAEKLNFNYTLHLPRDNGRYGIPNEHGNWTGVTGMVARGEVDMAVIYMIMTEQRAEVVDFIVPHSVMDKTFATDIPGSMSKYDEFISPFKPEIWLTVFFLFVIPKLFQEMAFLTKGIPNILSELWNNAESSRKSRNSLTHRILEGSFMIAKSFLKYFYASKLLSFLTIQRKQKGIRNMEDLATAIENGQYRCYVPQGGIDLEFFLTSDKERYRSLGKTISLNKWFFEGNHFKHKALGRNVAITGARLSLTVLFGKHPFSTVFLSDDSFGIWNVAIMVKKDFCCKSRLNEMVFRVISAGLYQKFVSDEMFRSQLRLFEKFSPEETVRPLMLHDLWGVFLALSILLLLSVALFLFELYYHNRNNRKLRTTARD